MQSPSKIKSVKIRACKGPDQLDPGSVSVALPGGSRPDFTVVTITTEDGTTGTSFGFGALDAKAAGCCPESSETLFHRSRCV